MSDLAELQTEAACFREDFQKLRDAVAQVIVGQQRVVDGVLTAIVAGGNVLLEGVPGLGKTELVKTLARALALDF
ncbi:MAG TPA: MoxR family ATPase, partial [Chthoniobacteraceae bacterium]|nr:MoxR family ATPase [Chthoniobacteraceae bacterium]